MARTSLIPAARGVRSSSGWSYRRLTPRRGPTSRSARSTSASLERPVLRVRADRRPREQDPADCMHVEGELAEVGRVRLRQLLEPQVDLPRELRDFDLVGREAL